MSKVLVDDLIQQIFEDRHSKIQSEFADWLSESRRFRSFADTYASKIRKKLRSAADEEQVMDLRSELETAYCLLKDKKFTLEYEKFGQGGRRAPDLSAAFRVNTLCHIEVTRPRMTGEAVDKLLKSLCDKVGQMLPGDHNLLVIDAPGIDQSSLHEAAGVLRTLAEQKDEEFFVRRRFKSAKDFLRLYQNMSAVALKGTQLSVWENPLSKKPLPKPLRRALENTL